MIRRETGWTEGRDGTITSLGGDGIGQSAAISVGVSARTQKISQVIESVQGSSLLNNQLQSRLGHLEAPKRERLHTGKTAFELHSRQVQIKRPKAAG